MSKNREEKFTKIRPHHGLCTEFFCGHGYSGEFAENMEERIKYLENENPVIILTDEWDIFCVKCPEMDNGSCERGGKPKRYDSRVSELCGLSAGEKMRWSEFKTAVRERILNKGLLSEVCGDCRWRDLCGK